MKTIAGSVVSRVVAMVIVIAMACPYAYAIGIGKVTYIEGRVDVAGQGSSIATPLREGDPISAGDAIRTKSNSKAEVTFNDKSMLRLAQNTRIEVKDYVLDTNNKRKTAEIMVDRGRARTIIEKMPGLTEFNISTPNAKGTVHGSDIYTSFQAGSSSMLVAEGQLSIINPTHPGKELIVPAGNSVIVPLDETPKGMRPYMDFEKKLQEQETAVPANIVRSQNATILKGVFTKISGDVRVTSKGSENSRKAALSDVLGEGDTIETGNNGVVEISFENGNGMNLQENTRITIIKLIQDPKTKQYDNRFEASMGKVRARIEKLKETKSTFEIKTPTALCGARGTLMYVQITPGSTKVFFEGGVGYLNSLISSMQSTVDAGQSAYADDSGKVSEPKTLSGEERESWGSGWNAGNGTEGYSSEGGTVGIYLESGDTGMGGSLEIVGSTDTNVNDSIVDVPFVPASAIEVIHDSNFNLTAEILYNGTKVGTMDDSEGGLVGSFWNAEKKADFISAGDFNLPDREKEPFVWTPIDDDVLKSRNPDTGSSVTATGGAFYGIAGGIGTATTADGGILEGISKFMYIDPDGNIGTAGGNLNGEYSDSDDIYILTSTSSGLTGKVLPDGKNIGVTAEGMAGSIWTNADNDENDGGDSSDGLLTISLVNYNADTPVAQTWGIYGGRGTGEFQSAPADGIVWHVSGRNSFGAYYDYDSEADKFKYDNGYWLADISDSVAGNKLSGSFSGRFLTGTKMGTIEGVMLGTFGTYDGKILYQAVSTGEWDGEPLTFSGTWLPEASTVYSKGFDGYSEGDFGLIGATTSPWKDQAKFLAIGEYNIDTETPGGAFIWNNFIESYDIITGDSTTIDGGFFYGLTTGVCNKEEVTGSSVAIYVDPDGIAGYLSSGLNGVYYSDNDVWMAEGVFNAEQIANGFNSKTVEISSEPLTVGYPYGDSESNRVKVSSGSGATYFISGKDWGIYRLDFDSEGNYYDRNGTSRTWSATISGSGPFGSGQSLGVMQGDFYGAAVDEGCWIGTVIGKWGKDEYYGSIASSDGIYYGFLGGIWDEDIMIGKMVGIYAQPGDIGPISSTSSMVKDMGSRFYDASSDIKIGYLSGIGFNFNNANMGIWSINFDGTYSESKSMSIFKLDILGSSKDAGDSFGGYWKAFCSGLLNKTSGRINGAIRSITLQDGNFALSSGDMLGATVDSNWEAVGLGKYERMGTTKESDPADENAFVNLIEKSSFLAKGLGSFSNGKAIDVISMDGRSINFRGQEWGIWEANLGGTCDTVIASTFKTAIGGQVDNDSKGCIIATMTGTINSGTIAAKFKGIWLESAGDNMVNAGTMSGVADGYVDISEPKGTWNAAAVGEWVEVTDLLKTDENKLRFNVDQLNQFVSVPITEVYSNILTGAGSRVGGVSVTNNLNDFLNFAFNSWTNNKWDANYSGRAGAYNIAGQAGGTYNDGTFKGVGAGGVVVEDRLTTLNTVTVSGSYVPSGTIPMSNVTANVAVYESTAKPPAGPPVT